MSFCQNCGQQIPDGAPQCPNCGAPLMQQAMNQQPVYQQNPYPNQQQAAPSINMQQQPKKKKGKGCLIAIAVVIGLCLLSSLSGNRNKNTADSSSGAATSATTKATTKKTTEKTAAVTTETDSIAETTEAPEAVEPIKIISGETNEYSEEYTLNEGTEFSDTNIVYFVPAGKYKVTNTGQNINQFNVYSRETHIVDGWEEPLYTPVVIMIDAGESDTVEIPENHYIEIHGGSFELSPLE